MDNNVMELPYNQWITILEAQAKSGLTKEDWCNQNNVSRGKFYRWQKIIREKTLAEMNAHRSCEIKPTFVDLPMNLPKDTSLSLLENSQNTSVVPVEHKDNHYEMMSISCGKFSVNVYENTCESLLETVLRTIANVQ